MSREFWEWAVGTYDLFTWGAERRYRTIKRRVFSAASGRTLLVGAGTGKDFELLPPGLELTALDYSAAMLERASPRAAAYPGSIRLQEADIERTGFAEGSFDTVIASCVFCSVADPARGLREVRRVLRPGGKLIMFEHVLSRNPLLKPMLYLMNAMVPHGPDFTRNTLAQVRAAGFTITRQQNWYMDIVKEIVAE